MVQHLIIGFLFAVALVYLFRMAYRSFQSRSDCATGCGKCNAVDFNRIEKQIREKGLDTGR